MSFSLTWSSFGYLFLRSLNHKMNLGDLWKCLSCLARSNIFGINPQHH